MRLENEEADSHRSVSLLKLRMLTLEKLRESDEIAERLAHLLSIDGNHIVVHPVMHALSAARSLVLGNLAFVVREHQIHSATVNVELPAEIFLTHHGALEMPARKTLSPR